MVVVVVFSKKNSNFLLSHPGIGERIEKTGA